MLCSVIPEHTILNSAVGANVPGGSLLCYVSWCSHGVVLWAIAFVYLCGVVCRLLYTQRGKRVQPISTGPPG